MKILILTMEFKCIFIVFRFLKKNLIVSYMYVIILSPVLSLVPGLILLKSFYPVTWSPPPPVVAFLLPNRRPPTFTPLLYDHGVQ